MGTRKLCNVLLLLFFVLFFLDQTSFAKSSVKRWRPFPNISLRVEGKNVSISSFTGHPILVLVGNTSEKWYGRLKMDLAESSQFLAKNGIKPVVLLLKGSELKEDLPWPYFIDKEGKFEQRFMEKEVLKKLPYYYFLDQRGRVALERQDIHGRILDIPKIVQVYQNLISKRTKNIDIQYGERTKAPDILLKDVYGKDFKLSSFKGKKSVLLILFSIDCSYCRRELPLLASLDNKPNVEVVGICSSGSVQEIRDFAVKNKIPFRIVKDASRTVFMRYKSTTTPESFVIDLDGYISYKHTGTSADLKNILDFELDKALGVSMPERLSRDSYVGSRVCRTCHPKEYNDWLGTPHSVAFSSLVKPVEKKNYENNKCLKCHVTGFGKQNGFKDWRETRHLMGVQCEVCHGSGHGNEKGKSKEEYKKVCFGCHTQKYSFSFSIDKAYEMIAHKGGEDLSAYTEEVRERIIKRRMSEKRRKKVSLGVGYVGNEKCRSCHGKEYTSWSKTKHAGAFDSLLKQRKEGSAQCLKCHTTAYGESNGGFMDINASPNMVAVGCEVCHGPGEDHANAEKGEFKSTIFGLVGKCKYCVIQGMCKTCHSLENSGCDAELSEKFDIDIYLPKIMH